MIEQLHIQNFAIIDDLRFEPGNRLNILTGETGAGKSILVDALGLLLGNRAKLEQDKKCIIEGIFNISQYNLQSFFTEKDLDYEPQTIIRREISPQGRSRAFINDTPVGLQDLKDLGVRLVDIHSQHQTLQIGNRDFQYKLIDVVSDSWDLFLSYRKSYVNWEKSLRSLEELRNKEAAMNRDLEFKKFQLDELISADLTLGEEEVLEEESELLENAEEILQIAAKGGQLIDNGESSIADRLASFLGELRHVNGGVNFDKIRDRVESVLTELRDISGELSAFDSRIALDPERLIEVNERLNLLRILQQKHRVNTVEELITIRETLDQDLLDIGDLSYEIKQIEEQTSVQKNDVLMKANGLFEKREQGLKGVEQRLNSDLLLLGMPNARFRLGISKKDVPVKFGMDELLLEFSANKGSTFQPVDKVASGGELSRIMLIIKSYFAERATLPTLIFDEIDTGVSGEIARKVAELMKALSEKHQLITITHLPQIAARANAHFYVYKHDVNGRTATGIRLLSEGERIEEVARMLSGDNPGEGALINAKELIG